jgi:hypothetical protein
MEPDLAGCKETALGATNQDMAKHMMLGRRTTVFCGQKRFE